MSRRSDRLARDVHERLAAVAAQLAAAPTSWPPDQDHRGAGGAGGVAGGWVPGRPALQPDGQPVAEPALPDHLPDALPDVLADLLDAPAGEPAQGAPADGRVDGAAAPALGRQREGVHRARRGLAAAGRRRRRPAAAGGRETGLGRPAVVGLAVVALLAAALAGGLMWRARPVPVEAVPARASAPADSGASPRPVRTVSSARAAPSQPSLGGPATPTGSGPEVAGPAGSTSLVVVHVVGQVRRPGLVRLPQGARVDDAVRAAGGATAGADLSGVNLARVVVDGEQLRVPAPGEVVPGTPAEGAAGGGPAADAPPAPLDLNRAGLADLDALPGVGPVLAQRILDWRSEHQRFSSVDELREVRGIGPKVFADLQPLVRV